MALATTWSSYATGAVAAPGTSVGPSLAVPDNCHTILVTNSSTTLTGLVGRAAPPAALSAGVNATPVAPGATLTLAVGELTERGAIDQAVSAGNGLAFDAIGGAVTLAVTYLNHVGG